MNILLKIGKIPFIFYHLAGRSANVQRIRGFEGPSLVQMNACDRGRDVI